MSNTIKSTSTQQAPDAAPAPTRSPRQLVPTILGWAAIAVGLVTASVLVVLALTSGPAGPPVRTEQSPTGQAPDSSMYGVPLSADAAERYLAEHGTTRPAGVPLSADAAERYLAEHGTTRPAGVPLSADAAERYLSDHEKGE